LDSKTSEYLTHTHFKILVGINLATLLAVAMIYLSRPAIDPRYDRLAEVVEAQDWLIGKMSEKMREQAVELVKLEFGMVGLESEMKFESLREEFESENAELDQRLIAATQKFNNDMSSLRTQAESMRREAEQGAEEEE
jgi:hypothetical protein